jgi:hypothetical protein
MTWFLPAAVEEDCAVEAIDTPVGVEDAETQRRPR